MLRLWRNAMNSNNSKSKQSSQRKVIYIAPLKALARERLNDWKRSDSLAGLLNIKVIELTGDTSQESETIRQADVIITTPEKFDVISRDWQHRRYVRQVGLVVVDEVHMLGADRGHVLEAIVSRLRCVATSTLQSIRIVALSTALANAGDLADWLGVDRNVGLYNFPPAVRPCPLSLHIAGFSGRHYCPRMQAMNRPAYAAILQHSPSKPALIFVSSRRQTRLTALDLIAYTAADGNPRKWLKMTEDELEIEQAGVRDANIRHMLAFGVGIHHAGLNERDRSTVERLFEQQRIQVLVATSTLAWGVNLPAHLVVVKGTEYFDGRTHRYIDYPITDVLQMTGRAGRPKYDQEGVAVVLVQDVKKPFYLNFLHSPFPVESSLLGNIQATSDDGYSSVGKSIGSAVTDDKLADHIAAECVNGTIRSLRDAMEYLSWTFLFRRLLVNPSYYACKSSEPDDIKAYLVQHIMSAFTQLSKAGLIRLEGKDDAMTVEPLFLGRIASFYYIKYNTVALYAQYLHAQSDLDEILPLLCYSSEYNEVPVRMTEDQLNAAMASACRLALELPDTDDSSHRRKRIDYGDPHIKANILLQYHIGQLQDALPIVDYKTDTKLVLDNAPRLLQAMLDLTAEAGWLRPTLNVIKLLQMISCSRWHDEPAFSLLPHLTPKILARLQSAHHIASLTELCQLQPAEISNVLKSCQLSAQQIADIQQQLNHIPALQLEAQVTTTEAKQSDTIKLQVTVRRMNPAPAGSSTGKRQPSAFCLLVTLKQQKKLLQLKRVTCNSKAQTIELMLNKADVGSDVADLSVQLVSQTYIGMEYETMAAVN